MQAIPKMVLSPKIGHAVKDIAEILHLYIAQHVCSIIIMSWFIEDDLQLLLSSMTLPSLLFLSKFPPFKVFMSLLLYLYSLFQINRWLDLGSSCVLSAGIDH